ncbi:MAG: glycerate kinase, partial [Burkholderiales bacterium]|nr:glycerate kinase [Burkholderiales bacterium]
MTPSPTAHPSTAPREFLTQLYQAAVQRALPLHSMAPFLPPPPRGRTLVLGA